MKKNKNNTEIQQFAIYMSAVSLLESKEQHYIKAMNNNNNKRERERERESQSLTSTTEHQEALTSEYS